MSDLAKYIQTYFGVIQPDELSLITDLFQPTELKKGDYFLKEGRPSLQLSFIQSGLLRIYAHTEEKEVTQWISTKGYFVTDLSSLVFETPARWTI